MDTLLFPRRTGTRPRSKTTSLEELRARLRGRCSPQPTRGSARTPIYNAMHDRRPALKVRATGTADVVDTINFARQRNLLVAVRGGGHSVAGLPPATAGSSSTCADAGGHVDPDGSAGVRAGGRSVAGRRPRDAGVRPRRARWRGLRDGGGGGLTLGGGEGWVRRKYGLTIDSLRAATVVCADGSVHVRPPDQDEDLFWAPRGGGGTRGGDPLRVSTPIRSARSWRSPA